MKSPTEAGTGRAKDQKAPLSEMIQVLNERFGDEVLSKAIYDSIPKERED